jgi:hypothetical protein
VNHGGEPAHDDYGLPRVDVEIPDDARELYRDVQAYHRELRALRRHQRSDRWRAPLRGSGMVVPLIAGCLVLAMIAGMVLTMFSASPEFSNITGQVKPTPGARHAAHAGRAGRAAGPARQSSQSPGSPSATGTPSSGPSRTTSLVLPDKTISVQGKPVGLRRLTVAAFAVVPANCGCARVVGQLLTQAMAAGITVYLVGRKASLTDLKSLVTGRASGTAVVAIDADNAFGFAYGHRGPTMLLVDSHGQVTMTSTLTPDFQRKLQDLQGTG